MGYRLMLSSLVNNSRWFFLWMRNLTGAKGIEMPNHAPLNKPVARHRRSIYPEKKIDVNKRAGIIKRQIVKRKKLPYVLRNKICANQCWKCSLCNMTFKDIWIIDHMVPLCMGGTNRMNNLQALCSSCNNFKTAYLDYQVLKKLVENGTRLTPALVKRVQEEEYANYHGKKPGITTLDGHRVEIYAKEETDVRVNEHENGLRISFDNELEINIIRH